MADVTKILRSVEQSGQQALQRLGERHLGQRLSGLHAQGATFEAVAWITHMGLTHQQGDLFFVGPVDPDTLTAPGIGSVTMTAANGDQLSFDYEGTLFAATARASAHTQHRSLR